MDFLLGLEFISHCPCCGSSNVTKKDAVLSPFFSGRALGVNPVKIEIGEFRDLNPGTSYQPCSSIYCSDCMSVACSARLSPASMNRYYQGYQDKEFIDMRVMFEPSFAERLKRRTNTNTLRIKGERCSYIDKVESYYLETTGKKQPTAILDYGGGTGANTPFASLALIEIVDIDVSNSTPDDSRLSSHLDLVCLMNVLEHVNNPGDVLRRALEYYGSATDILIELPLERFMHDVTITASYNHKKIWTEHINCFSPTGFMNLVENAGLKPYDAQPTLIETSALGDNLAEENSIAMLLVSRYDP